MFDVIPGACFAGLRVLSRTIGGVLQDIIKLLFNVLLIVKSASLAFNGMPGFRLGNPYEPVCLQCSSVEGDTLECLKQIGEKCNYFIHMEGIYRYLGQVLGSGSGSGFGSGSGSGSESGSGSGSGSASASGSGSEGSSGTCAIPHRLDLIHRLHLAHRLLLTSHPIPSLAQGCEL